MTDLVIDFNNPLQKQMLYFVLKDLKGVQVIKIKKKSTSWSKKYHRYYFGCILEYAEEEFDAPKLLIHNHYKHKFMHLVKVTEDFVNTTTDMSYAEQEKFVNLVRKDLLEEWGIRTPEPNEVIL